MVNRSSLKVILVIAGVFVSGMGTGAAVTMAWSHHRLVSMIERGGPFHQEMRMRALQRTLQLSSDQRRAISAILERDAPTRRKLTDDAMQACGEPLRNHKAQIDAEIRAVLRPDQQIRFDELAKRQAERFHLGPPRGPKGPPPATP
jgi:hypothetical protein